MKTRVEKAEPGSWVIGEAAAIIRAGGVVAFPTETVYGLGANGLDADACAKIYEAKGRPSDNPLILHVASREMIGRIASDVPEAAEKLIVAFMPGPVTLILPRNTIVPDCITGGLATVGIRMPSHPVARALIAAADVPIAAPSANISGRPSPTMAASVLRDMEGRIPLILDGGPCRYGVESTIIDVTEGEATILRPGAVTREVVEDLLGSCRVDPALLGASDVPKAPGMKYRHYAPKADMTLFVGAPEKVAQTMRERAQAAQSAGRRVGVLASREVTERLRDFIPAELCLTYGAEGDEGALAHSLYESLLTLDALGTDVILAEGTGEDGFGLAVMNRLKKASGGHVEYV